MLDGRRRIDQYGVAFAIDEGRRNWRPHTYCLARRQIVGNRSDARRHEDLPTQEFSVIVHCYLLSREHFHQLWEDPPRGAPHRQPSAAHPMSKLQPTT